MRQAFVDGRSSLVAAVTCSRRRLRISHRAFLWASAISIGVCLGPVFAFADDPKSETPAPTTVSPAKPVAQSTPPVASAKAVGPINPAPESAGKQQAKNYISLGPIFGFTTHVESPVTGILGAEISYVRYPYAAFGFGMGGFAQAQTVGFNHARFAFGPQFNFMMFGAEVGAFLEDGNGKRATTVGVHASPFVSLGFFSAALRIAVPIGTLTAGDPYGIDIGLVCAMKVPIPLDGQLFGLAFH